MLDCERVWIDWSTCSIILTIHYILCTRSAETGILTTNETEGMDHNTLIQRPISNFTDSDDNSSLYNDDVFMDSDVTSPDFPSQSPPKQKFSQFSRPEPTDFQTSTHKMEHYAPGMMIEGFQSQIKPGDTSFMSMDPVQSDLYALGIKSADHNIHKPPYHGTPIDVNISISLRNILEIDELRQLITVETTMRLYWMDKRLQVGHLLPDNKHENSSDDYVLLHPSTANYIWFPDIYIDFAKALRFPSFMVQPASLRIYRNSTLRYATQINYDVACPMHFRKYPYDTQVCKVKYESYGHTTERMTVKWKKGFDMSRVTDNNSISLAQFEYVVRFEEEYKEAIASGEYPGVIMTIVLRRKINYHLLQTYLPSGLFVIVAWLSLFLPPESIPGRVAMAMTTLLTLAAMFGAVRQNTPRVSYVSALDVWMCVCIIFVFFTLLEYVIVLCLIYKKDGSKNDEDEDHEEEKDNNCVKITTIDCSASIQPNKPPNYRKKRFRLCPRWNRKAATHGEDVLVVTNRPRKKKPKVHRVKPHLIVEKACIYLMAILFAVFNGIYWPLLMWEDRMIDYTETYKP